jgi:Ca2+-binding EF-hand superfamily protein
MKKTLSQTLLSTLLMSSSCILVAVASAEQLPMRGPIPFSSYDRNGNAIIDKQEFSAVQAERNQQRSMLHIPKSYTPEPPVFADYDRNGDGGITADELLAGQKAQMLKRANMLDTGKPNGIGQGHIPLFSEYDLNNDGVLMEHEYIQAQQARVNARQKEGFMMRGLGNGKPFSTYDLDADGEVTPEEFSKAESLHQQQAEK